MACAYGKLQELGSQAKNKGPPTYSKVYISSTPSEAVNPHCRSNKDNEGEHQLQVAGVG